MPRISVVVPTLNEAGVIAQVLSPLQAWRAAGHEIIVVDGHSTDGTLRRASPLADHCIAVDPGRAAQLNAGALIATGSLLLFLHADSALPANTLATLTALSDARTPLWGRFDVSLAAPGFLYRLIETGMNLRSRLTGVATGDQAIFVTRTLFERVGGFPSIALMEDVALSKRLRHEQWPCCLRLRVRTSARRWQREGIIRTIIMMWGLRLGYFCGVSPAHLQAVYESRRGETQ